MPCFTETMTDTAAVPVKDPLVELAKENEQAKSLSRRGWAGIMSSAYGERHAKINRWLDEWERRGKPKVPARTPEG